MGDPALNWIFLCLALGACGPWIKPRDSKPSSRRGDLEALFTVRQDTARGLRDESTRWLARNDCDAMIFAGKYATVAEDVNIEAAQYPDIGKWGRRPPPWCWTPEGGDQGSKTEWSRDMAIAGLLPYAWVRGRRDILENHAAYGRAHNWQMGEPLADLRTVYTPELQGLLYKLIRGLGGADNPNALWPSVYPTGLTDFEAHLQVMEIWLQGEAANALHDADATPKKPDGAPFLMDDGEWLTGAKGELVSLDISAAMYQRLAEHATREPECALYQAVYGIYSGDMSPAVNLLLDGSHCSYVRCSDQRQCELADWLFTAGLTLKHVAP